MEFLTYAEEDGQIGSHPVHCLRVGDAVSSGVRQHSLHAVRVVRLQLGQHACRLEAAQQLSTQSDHPQSIQPTERSPACASATP